MREVPNEPESHHNKLRQEICLATAVKNLKLPNFTKPRKLPPPKESRT